MPIRESVNFTYAGITSQSMGLINVSVNSGLYKEPILGEKNIKEVKIRGRDLPYFQQTQYEEPLLFDVTFAFEDPYDSDKIREVCRWLFDQDDYKPLKFESDERYFYCLVEGNSDLIHNGNLEGYISIIFKSDAPYGFTEETTTSVYDFTNSPFSYIETTKSDFSSGTLFNVEATDSNNLQLIVASTPTFTRASVANKSDFSQVPINSPRYESNGSFNKALTIEEGTTNILGVDDSTPTSLTYEIFNESEVINTSGTIDTSFVIDNEQFGRVFIGEILKCSPTDIYDI